MLDDALKRVFDLAAAAGGIVVLTPLLGSIALVVKLDSNGPIIYRGRRTGRHGVEFDMLKFRTMVPDAERRGGPSTAQQDPRLTRVGRLIRKYKLDELPQLFNVLRGEMSIVGPRPEVPQYTALYVGEERAILSVRPGITDYSSIEFADLQERLGRDDVDRIFETEVMPRKTALRLAYVKNRSFLEDMRIVARTFVRLAGL